MTTHTGGERLRVAFVMEIGLGHTTLYKLFQSTVAQDPTIVPTWLPIEFGKHELLAHIPKLRNDIVLRGGVSGWRKLRAALRHQRFDAIFFHTQMIAVFCSAIMRRTPTIVSIDGTPSQFAAFGEHYGLPDPKRTSWRERLRERWYKDVFQSAACVVAISQWGIDAAITEYGVTREAARVIYPGVDLQKWMPGKKRDNGKLRLLFVGGEFRRKGGDLLLRWMRERGCSHCELDVVTGTDVEPTPGTTVHRGFGPNDPRLIELYRSADLFVLPTRADMASLVAMEAMASGIPVVSTRVGAIPEWLCAPGDPGFVVDPDDYDGLARTLDDLTVDRSRLRAMGARARKRAETHFDGQANMRQELSLVREVAQAASRSTT